MREAPPCKYMHKSEHKLRFHLREPAPAQRLFVKLLPWMVSPTLVVDRRQPYCDKPVASVLWQRGGRGFRSLQVERWLPCRNCAKCLQFKAARWRERILAEIAAAPRSWYQTLTFAPTLLAGVHLEAQKLIPSSVEDSDRPEALRRAVEVAAYAHVQRYLDRLRKAGPSLRYFAVFERGSENDREHFHLVMHEVDRPLTSRLLEDKWRPSLSYPRLVREDVPGRGVSYLTKYLTKTSEARPRASLRYGDTESVSKSRARSGSCTATTEQGRPTPLPSVQRLRKGGGNQPYHEKDD